VSFTFEFEKQWRWAFGMATLVDLSGERNLVARGDEYVVVFHQSTVYK
jgi:hypothetical protein